MQLIPAIDLRQGKVVRLSRGDDGQRTTYERDPRELLAEFAAAGVERVHIVDLDGAFGETPQRALIESLLAETELQVEMGGGLRDPEAVTWALGAGCDRIVLGSMVAKDFPRFRGLVEEFPNCLMPAVEVAKGKIKVSGWTESASIGLEELCAQLRGLPCPAALVTDVSRDGTLAGPNLELTRQVAIDTGIPTILSGGVHSLDDLRAAGRAKELAGAIIGKAYYDGRIDLGDALRAVAEGKESRS